MANLHSQLQGCLEPVPRVVDEGGVAVLSAEGQQLLHQVTVPGPQLRDASEVCEVDCQEQIRHPNPEDRGGAVFNLKS